MTFPRQNHSHRCAVILLIVALGLSLAMIVVACAPGGQAATATLAEAGATATVTPRPVTPAAGAPAGNTVPHSTRVGSSPVAPASPAATRGATATPRHATAGPTPADIPDRVAIPTAPPLTGRPVAETAHYWFYDVDGAQEASIALLLAEADDIYAYVSDRTGLQLDRRIAVVVQAPAPGNCPARGVAFSSGARIGIFADTETPAEQLRAALAHETAHILHFATLGEDRLDLTLSEGFANWSSLRYWSAWQGLASFEEARRAYLADGRFVSLADPPRDCTVRQRDVMYNERASFAGYLIARHGFARFLAASGTEVPAPNSTLERIADYQAVYGLSFDELIDEWLALVIAGETFP